MRLQSLFSLFSDISSAFAMKCMLALAVIVMFRTNLLFSQSPTPQSETGHQEFDQAIEDNSFLIEEAYNQEAGVVQHISTFTLFRMPTKNVSYSFTQEWPVVSQQHQVSVTIPYSWLDGNIINGIGDVLLNYRYQLQTADDWAAFAPRLSLILPIGNADKGLGNGVLGFQINLPASKRLTNYLVIHANAGTTIFPGMKSTTVFGDEVNRTLTSFNLGASAIVLVTPKFNLMLEVGENFLSAIDGTGEVVRSTETIISPGVRAAIDIGELQIVPGFAVPLSFSNGDQRTGVFLYLSFEHPF